MTLRTDSSGVWMATSAIEPRQLPADRCHLWRWPCPRDGLRRMARVVPEAARDVRTGQHGGYSSTGLRVPLELTIKGIVTYTDEAACAAERRVLLALGVSGLPVSLEVTDALGSFTVEVEVSEADVHPLNDKVLTFEFAVAADDPVIRGATAYTTVVASGATVAVDNDGTVAADLIVTLTSTGTVVLTAGGLTLTTTSLPSGAVIDTGACTVTSSGGADLFSSVLPGSQWPALPAGGGSVAQAGTAGLSVQSFDTYA